MYQLFVKSVKWKYHIPFDNGIQKGEKKPQKKEEN